MSDWARFVYYDESSPSGLRWAIDRGNHVRKGDVVGCIGKKGHWQFQSVALGDNKRRYCHRVIWELHYGPIEDDLCVDHINGVSTDNRLSNLRKVPRKVNNRNVAMHRRNTSGITGVSRRITESDGKQYHYWVAQWRTLAGGNASAVFSVAKLGEDAARQAAIDRRDAEIANLNASGAEYSERHGLVSN